MASNPDEGRRQAMLEKQRKDMMEEIARQKEALQQVRDLLAYIGANLAAYSTTFR